MDTDEFISLSGFRPQKILISVIFIFSILYWSYLAFVSQAIIIHDAEGYQNLGKLIYERGWVAYFKTGPTREPIYPFLVSLAMRIADTLSCPYQTILKIIHLFILTLTQALLAYVLVKNRVKGIVTLGVLFYFAVSPAVVNSALTVYSEIACYPFLMALVLASANAWQAIQLGDTKRILFAAFFWGASFIGITLVKGIYEIIFPFFLIAFLALSLTPAAQQHGKNRFNGLILVMLTSGIFFLSIGYIKSLNKKYNGIYTLTDRSSLAFYGSTARRMERLDARKFLTATTYHFLGEDHCYALFTKNECDFWGIKYSDELSRAKLEETARHLPKERVDPTIIAQTTRKILGNPFQFLLLAGIDWLKMFSWESTRIGFAVYPDWLDKIYDCKPFKNILETLIGVLSFLSFIYLPVSMRRRQHTSQNANRPLALYFALLSVIFLHVSFYSLFATVTRWALPLAPLYLLLMAFAINDIATRKS